MSSADLQADLQEIIKERNILQTLKDTLLQEEGDGPYIAFGVLTEISEPLDEEMKKFFKKNDLKK